MHDKTLRRLGIEGTYLSIIEAIYSKLTASTMQNRKTHNTPIKVRSKITVSSPLLFNTEVEGLARACNKTREEIRGT